MSTKFPTLPEVLASPKARQITQELSLLQLADALQTLTNSRQLNHFGKLQKARALHSWGRMFKKLPALQEAKFIYFEMAKKYDPNITSKACVNCSQEQIQEQNDAALYLMIVDREINLLTEKTAPIANLQRNWEQLQDRDISPFTWCDAALTLADYPDRQLDALDDAISLLKYCPKKDVKITQILVELYLRRAESLSIIGQKDLASTSFIDAKNLALPLDDKRLAEEILETEAAIKANLSQVVALHPKKLDLTPNGEDSPSDHNGNVLSFAAAKQKRNK